MDVEWKSLVSFVGRDVSFIIKEVDEDNNRLFLSRKEAQAILRPTVMKELQSGAVVGTRVVNLLPYGAYLEYKGISGLLKNVDFSLDHTAVKDVLNLGDIVNVKLKNTSNNDKISFEVVEKYSNPTIMDLDVFERDQVVLGIIRNIKPFGAFVNVAPGHDALCPIPTTREIEEGMKVAIRITKVDKENGRIRGKIVR
jgi:small subunit ribosomal protein S1